MGRQRDFEQNDFNEIYGKGGRKKKSDWKSKRHQSNRQPDYKREIFDDEKNDHRDYDEKNY